MYREGEVRELELTDKDAIVHRRVKSATSMPSSSGSEPVCK
jgi:hypothetical protein